MAVLDLRGGWGPEYDPPPHYAAGHVPGSVPLDVRTLLGEGWPSTESVLAVLRTLGPRANDPLDLGSEFVLVAGESDRLAGLGYFLLRLAGLRVRMLEGGWEGWIANAANPVLRRIEEPGLRKLLAAEADAWERDEITRGLMLVDVREKYDFASAHLPGAASLADSEFEDWFETLKELRWPDLGRDTPLVVYCYGPTCVRSRNCAALAAGMGYTNLYWYRGGIASWMRSDLPVFKGRRSKRR